MQMIAGALVIVAGAILFAGGAISQQHDVEPVGYLGGLALVIAGGIMMVRGWLKARPTPAPRDRNEER